MKRSPATITFLCHKYLMTTFRRYNIYVMLADITDIRIFFLSNVVIGVCPKIPYRLGLTPFVTL